MAWSSRRGVDRVFASKRELQSGAGLAAVLIEINRSIAIFQHEG
jgi:hypothetical protein